MNWTALAAERTRAAEVLRDQGLYRDAVNRVYYAVYSHAVERVHGFGPFKDGRWTNPPHDEVPGLLGRLTGYSNESKKEMRSVFKELFKKRVDADYRPGVLIDEAVVRHVFRKALRFWELIGREP
jgi:uncharacterized protein (UPF0332 family)